MADEPVAVSEAVEAAPVETETTTTTTETVEADPFDVETNDTFDRKYVEKLRKENASSRERAKAAEERAKVFGDDPEIAEAWADLIGTYNTNPEEAATRMQQISEQILAGKTTEEAVAAVDGDEEDRPLTRKEYDALRAQEAAQDQLSKDVEGIQQHAVKLGYDVNSDDYLELLVSADKNHGGDIQKAHESREARKQKVIDDYIAAKQKEAEGGTSPVAGGAPSSAKDIKTFEDADRATRARVGAIKRKP